MMWHKAEWMRHLMELKLTLASLLVKLANNYITQSSHLIYKAFSFDVAQGFMNGAPNENQTHLCRFAGLAC